MIREISKNMSHCVPDDGARCAKPALNLSKCESSDFLPPFVSNPIRIWILDVDGTRCIQDWEPSNEESAGAVVTIGTMDRQVYAMLPDFDGF